MLGSNRGTILWVLDTFDTADELMVTVRFLSRLLGKAYLDALPLAVLSPVHLKIGAEVFASLRGELAEGARERLQPWLAALADPRVRPLEIVVTAGRTSRDDARDVVELATRVGVRAILMTVRPRAGARAWLEGFAENVISRSHVPVFIVNHGGALAEHPDDILFPTTFADRDQPCFLEVVDLAQICGAKITLYHKGPATGLEAVADAWRARAALAGIDCKLKIDAVGGFFLSALFDEIGAGGYGLVAVVARAASFSLAGTVAREVVRRSKCPALILKSENCRRV